MTEMYGIPNTGEFWHWSNALHFVLVGLAGGMAFVAAWLSLAGHRERDRYLLLAAALIVLDLFVLWAESGARWRFSQVWLFLSFNPAAPIWWGAWGLAFSLLMSGALLLRGPVRFLMRVPEKVLAVGLLMGSIVALMYPGFALAINVTRPLWNSWMVAIYPVTALLMVLGLALLMGSAWARRWELALAAGSLGLLLVYPLSLSPEAQDYLRSEGWLGYAVFVGLLLLGLALFRSPKVAAGMAVTGAAGVRWVLVMVGQYQGVGL